MADDLQRQRFVRRARDAWERAALGLPDVEAEARRDWLDNRDLDDDTKLDLRRDAREDERDLAEREHDDEMRDADDATSDPR